MGCDYDNDHDRVKSKAQGCTLFQKKNNVIDENLVKKWIKIKKH